MSKKQTVTVMVEGGAATAGPPLGPALGPMGVNAAKVVEEINKATQSFKGMRIPVDVIVDPATKQFEIKVGSPPTSALILKAIGIPKGGGTSQAVGDIGFDQLLEVAKSKMGGILASDIKAGVKEIIGVCQSLKVTVSGLTPKEITSEVNSGKLDDFISGKTTVLPQMTHHEEEVNIVGIDVEKPKEEKPKVEDTEAKVEDAAKSDQKLDDKKKAPVKEDKKDKKDKKEKK